MNAMNIHDMTIEEKISLLSSTPLFGGLRDDCLIKIFSLMKTDIFQKDEYIIKEGDIGDCIYFIIEGRVSILKNIKKEGSVKMNPIASLKTGDCFGEMEIIDIQPRAATVRTLEKTHLLILTHRDLYTLRKWDLESFTMIIMNLAREISRRLRIMDNLAANINE